MPNRKVLIVDDSKTERHVLSEMLQKNGYVVFTAENGTRGLEQSRRDSARRHSHGRGHAWRERLSGDTLDLQERGHQTHSDHHLQLQGSRNRQDLGTASGRARVPRQARDRGGSATEDRGTSPDAEPSCRPSTPHFASTSSTSSTAFTPADSVARVLTPRFRSRGIDVGGRRSPTSSRSFQFRALVSVPLAADWFVGVANIRGSSVFRDRPCEIRKRAATPTTSDSRLVCAARKIPCACSAARMSESRLAPGEELNPSACSRLRLAKCSLCRR